MTCLYFQKLRNYVYNYSLPIHDHFCAIFEGKFWPKILQKSGAEIVYFCLILTYFLENTTSLKRKSG